MRNLTIIMVIVCSLVSANSIAQNFDKDKVYSKNKVFVVKRINNSVNLREENTTFVGKKMSYNLDTLKLSGILWEKAKSDVTIKILNYLTDKRKIDVNKLPNIFSTWYVTPGGIVKDVSFTFRSDLPLSAQDFEEMSRIISQTKVQIVRPEFYKSVDFIPLAIPFIWKQQGR